MKKIQITPESIDISAKILYAISKKHYRYHRNIYRMELRNDKRRIEI